MFRMDGKVAIITGGARGQGEATAKIFAEQGATVVIADVLVEEGEALAKKLGGSVRFRKLDVSDEASWGALIGELTADGNSIDALVNNAAIVMSAPMLEMRKTQLEQVLAVNLVGPFLGMQAVLPAMLKAGKGSIVNVSSVNGLRGTSFMTAYDASKWGLRGLTKGAALEFAPYGIRINSLHPGAIDTPMLNPEGKDTAEISTRMRIQFGRVGRPEEVGYASLFLSSDEASYISGAELAVDGTWSAGVNLQNVPQPAA